MEAFLIPLLTERKAEAVLPDFPPMYALAKNGNIRTYQVHVEDKGDHAVVTTSKQTTLNGKLTQDEYEYCTGVNIGKANETTYLEQAYLEAQSIYNKLRDSGFSEELPTGKHNTDAQGNIKPMLASANITKASYPCLCQPKFDGVRCLILLTERGVEIVSRKGKPYNIPHLQRWAEENKHLLPLDGELYSHDITFQEITSAVKRESELTPLIKYMVYDRPIEGDNISRWHNILEKMGEYAEESSAPITLSPSVVCNDEEDVWKLHSRYVKDGYEGVMIRNFSGVYEFGFRSKDLIKVKVFQDAEFEVIEVLEATGRDAGTALFRCKCGEGEDDWFRVKPQGTRELRKEYFENAESIVGKFVTVQFQDYTDDGKPRFPSAIAVRDYE